MARVSKAEQARKLLKKALDEQLPVEKRAEILAVLAQQTGDPRTAAVALRAVETANELTGLSPDKRSKDDAPISVFVLPADTKVKVKN